MGKTFATILATALVVAPTTAIVNAAIVDAAGPQREASSTPPRPEPKSQGVVARVNCHSLRCINRNLTALNRDAFSCEKTVDLTSYPGFLYNNGSSTTTASALDYTDPGFVPSDSFVVYRC